MTKPYDDSNVTPLHQHQRDVLSENWTKLIRQILHDIRSPLMGIGLNTSSIKENLDTLVEAYKKAVAHDLIEQPLRSDKLQQLQTGITSINNQTRALNSFINQFNPLCKKITDKPDATKQQTIKFFIDDFLTNHSFQNPAHREMLQVDIAINFNVTDEVFFLKHLMSRLLEHLAEARKDNDNSSKAEISTAEEDNHYILLFTATGNGDNENTPITNSINDDRFFTKPKDGGSILPGIRFCKLAIEQHGGEIIQTTTIDSNQEKIVFTIKFAKLN